MKINGNFVIPDKSAHSKHIKMSVLVEEEVVRIKNCCQGLDWEELRGIMEECKFRMSGYPATVRHQAVNEALTNYENMCKVE